MSQMGFSYHPWNIFDSIANYLCDFQQLFDFSILQLVHCYDYNNCNI